MAGHFNLWQTKELFSLSITNLDVEISEGKRFRGILDTLIVTKSTETYIMQRP